MIKKRSPQDQIQQLFQSRWECPLPNAARCLPNSQKLWLLLRVGVLSFLEVVAHAVRVTYSRRRNEVSAENIHSTSTSLSNIQSGSLLLFLSGRRGFSSVTDISISSVSSAFSFLVVVLLHSFVLNASAAPVATEVFSNGAASASVKPVAIRAAGTKKGKLFIQLSVLLGQHWIHYYTLQSVST